MTPRIVEHLERHLGTASGGWSGDSRVKVLCFPDRPERSVVAYTTLGLSDVVLPMPGGRGVRQELIMAVRASYDADAMASMLGSFADYILSQGRALLRGDVVGPGPPLIPGVGARGLYASIPVVFPDGLATFQETTPPTVLVWLIPLPPGDVDFVRAHGWAVFEDHLERVPVDLWDLDRPAIPHPSES